MAETPLAMTVQQFARAMALAKSRERVKIAGEIASHAEAALGEGKIEVAEALIALTSYVSGNLAVAIQPDAYDAAVAAHGDLDEAYNQDDLPAVKLLDDGESIGDLLARRPVSGFNPSV